MNAEFMIPFEIFIIRFMYAKTLNSIIIIMVSIYPNENNSLPFIKFIYIWNYHFFYTYIDIFFKYQLIYKINIRCFFLSIRSYIMYIN